MAAKEDSKELKDTKKSEKDQDLEDIDALIEAFKGEELPSGNTLECGLAALEKLRREGRIH